LIILIFFSFTNDASAVYVEMSPGLTKTATGDLNYTIFCNDNITINKIEQLYTAQTSGTVFDLITPSQTVRATTTGTTGVLEFNFTNLTCTASSTIAATLDFISGDSSWNWRRLVKTSAAITGYTPKTEDTIIYADAAESGYWFPQNFTIRYTHVILASSTASSSSSMGTTTVVTANDQTIQFFLLFAIMFMVLFGIIALVRPFIYGK